MPGRCRRLYAPEGTIRKAGAVFDKRHHSFLASLTRLSIPLPPRSRPFTTGGTLAAKAKAQAVWQTTLAYLGRSLGVQH